MAISSIPCPKCGGRIAVEGMTGDQERTCGKCGRGTRITLFPSAFRNMPVSSAGTPLGDAGDASCFFHPEKTAVAPCDCCGRYLCSLCAVDVGERRICSACIYQGAGKKSGVSFENQRVLYGNIALAVAIFPMLIFYLVVFTAPVAIFIAIRNWKKPGPMFSRRRWREGLAVTIGVMQLVGVAVGGYLLYLVFTADSRSDLGGRESVREHHGVESVEAPD